MRRACWLFAMPVTGVAVTPLTSTAIAKSFHEYCHDIAASIGIEVAPLDGGTERSPHVWTFSMSERHTSD